MAPLPRTEHRRPEGALVEGGSWGTEARVRRTAIESGELEPVVVEEDARAVERAIFSGFMEALDAAGPGGAVLFATRRLGRNGGTVCIWSDPAEGGGGRGSSIVTFGARP